MPTPEIYEAAIEGDIDKVEDLLNDDPAQINAADEYGFTALHGVAGEDQLEIARLLLEHGANVDARNDEGITPLHLAAYSEMVDLLTEYGAELNARSNEGETPLHIQVSEVDSFDTVQRLLELGADVNLKNDFDETPLDIALSREDDELIELLREYGALTGEEIN